MGITMPINVKVAQAQAKHTKKAMQGRDIRVKFLNGACPCALPLLSSRVAPWLSARYSLCFATPLPELLQGVRIIKYFAWEKAFADQVSSSTRTLHEGGYTPLCGCSVIATRVLNRVFVLLHGCCSLMHGCFTTISEG